MVADFTHVKRIIMDEYDHQDLNEVMPHGVPTTAENLAHAIATLLSVRLPRYRCDDAMLYPYLNIDSVTVFETPGNEVTVTW